MSYRSFAIATLVVAPVIVMAVQNFLPHTANRQAVQPPVAQAPIAPPAVESGGSFEMTPPPVAPMTPPSGMVSANDPSAFAQPMAGAGQPALAPGQGLPDATQPLSSPPPSSGFGSSPTGIRPGDAPTPPANLQ